MYSRQKKLANSHVCGMVIGHTSGLTVNGERFLPSSTPGTANCHSELHICVTSYTYVSNCISIILSIHPLIYLFIDLLICALCGYINLQVVQYCFYQLPDAIETQHALLLGIMSRLSVESTLYP